MAVKGLDYFVKYFAGLDDCFILIGGAACDLWMDEQGLEFRATKDLDLVVVAETLRKEFFVRFREFIGEGQYGSMEQSEHRPEFYRFRRPKHPEHPFMMELLNRNLLDLPGTVHLTPIPSKEDASSLSAILLDDRYYTFVKSSRVHINGIPTIPAYCLIPLKARAYLDLQTRKSRGDKHVKNSDIKKHRYDVFRIFRTLAPASRFSLPEPLLQDMAEFLSTLTAESTEWMDIRAAVGAELPPVAEILRQLRENFTL